MKISGMYSFNKGQEFIERNFAPELKEVKQAIDAIDAEQHRRIIPRTKLPKGKARFKRLSLQKAFRQQFYSYGWHPYQIPCEYPTQYYVSEYPAASRLQGAFREMDFVKSRLGVEVQFGKYAFMVYNVCAKMTIFRNEGIIDAGVEIVPLKEMAEEMSTGVSYFEQFVWDLEHRGVADIDIPVLILGVTA